MLKNAYIIDAEELQKRISREIESLKYNYREWRLAEPGSHDSETRYTRYECNLAVLRALLRIQGLDGTQVAMIINNIKDLAEYDSIKYRISVLDGKIAR